MLARGDGAIVVVNGLTASVTMPGMSGVGPAMAAARNYIFTLNAEVAQKGVYAGTMSIGAFLDRSAGMRAATAGGHELDPRAPGHDPDVVAGEGVWLVTQRARGG